MKKNAQEKAPVDESEIEKLRSQLAEKEQNLRDQEEARPEAEVTKTEKEPEQKEIKETGKGKIEKEAPQKEEAPDALSPSMDDPEILKELKGVIESGASTQVVQLAYRAFEKGVPYAMSIAGKIKDPSILAEFRGILVGELYKNLKEKKKL